MSRPHPVVAYMRGVLDGSIPACELIRCAVQRHQGDLERGGERGLHFDRAAAEHVVQFFGFLRHSKGEWAGKPFELEPWQQFLLWVLFGWKRADGLRRFRTAYIELPRKQGKSALASGIGLYLMVADGEPGAEIYSAARKRDQAKLVWGEAARMVRASPALSRMVREWRASSTLAVEATASKFVPLGADADTMDGLNVHGAIIDELHAHPTSAVVDVLETATGARRQPLIFEITTAGYDRQSICWQHHEYSRQVLEGSIVDDSWFAFIAAADEADYERWDDPAVWARANPNLNVSVKLDDLQRKAEKARHMPSAQNAFMRLHLNIWTQQSDRFIDLALWDANNLGVVADEALSGRNCYGGLDLSAVSDLTAWVMVWPREDDPETIDVLARFWCPEARLTAEDNRYRDQYQAWARDGWLEVTPGNAVDYAFVKRRVLADASRYQLVDLNVDRLFQGYQLSQELLDEGLQVFGMGQGYYGMAAPMREFERRLLAKKINHQGNPVLRWMANNLAVRQDPAGNLKPDKAESQGKIDGLVALLMALDRAMRHGDERSVYEERGILVL
jgi:phage terminase large subunit-like protein